jgi:hypothetical protein
MLEQRHAIKSLVKEQNDANEIHRRLKTGYGDKAMKREEVCRWALEIQRKRKDVSDSPRPGRQPEIGIDEILAHKLKRDPHATKPKQAYSVCIPANSRGSLAKRFWHEAFPLEVAPHLLTSSQKSTGLELVKVIAQQLAIHAKAEFQYLLIGDES